MRRGSIVTIIILILLVLVNIFVFWYFKNTTHDTRVLSDISQIRSSLELAFSMNTEYPISGSPIPLAERDAGTEKLCKEGFRTYISTCTETLLGSVPSSYKDSGEIYYYSTTLSGDEYWLEFNLKFNHKKLGLNKGTICATSQGLASGACPLNQ